MWDTSNLFVAAALSGGLVTLVLVIWVFKRSFGAVGAARKKVKGDRKQEWFLWCVGSALFACVVACFGIAFLYQSQMLLFALPAFISVATFEAKRMKIRKVDGLADAAVPVASGNAGIGLALDEGTREMGTGTPA
jgi:membrane protease YdiL (CAAX protease family)